MSSIAVLIKLGHYLTPHTQINSQQIEDSNSGPETIKLLAENFDPKLLDIVMVFLSLTQEAKATRARINKTT